MEEIKQEEQTIEEIPEEQPEEKSGDSKESTPINNELLFNDLKKYVDIKINEVLNKISVPEVERIETPEEIVEW